MAIPPPARIVDPPDESACLNARRFERIEMEFRAETAH